MNSKDQKLQMMREEKIQKLLLKMGMPTMIGMLVSPQHPIFLDFLALVIPKERTERLQQHCFQ
ncbi:MAG: hypothetical protein PHG19_10645, partial [Anaerotignum sp.]|nr:hypothetical protein [Anaerotignum sp.]